MHFAIVGQITDIEIIAVGRSIRELERLRDTYGSGRWRKLKEIATVEFLDGSLRDAEVHWYEASGVGRMEIKIKRFID